MCFLEWINLGFLMFEKQLLEFLDTDKILSFPLSHPWKKQKFLAEIL